MGTISQLHDRVRSAAHRIESEEEAVATARNLAAGFALQASERDINRILPYAELDTLAQSGLTAITIPAEHEGLDVANALLGEIVAIVAEGDPSIAECLEVHFRVLEQLRIEGGDELKNFLFARALAGDLFSESVFLGPGTATPSGMGYQLSGRSVPSTAILFSDWIAARAIDADGKPTTLYLPREADGLQIIDDWDGFGQRANGTATAVANGVRVNSDAVSRHVRQGPLITSALAALLHAATDLGIARAALASLKHAPRSAIVGKLVISLEATAALVESAGGKVDFAQVTPSTKTIEIASFSASAAQSTASAAALEATNSLFQLSSDDAASIGLNLDRHWRNARIHARGAATDDLYIAAAEHYFGSV
ncbi:acyl-CoA dehydrogenase family protein [Rhizobium sp. Root1220]|uniref:acyl-CoA dehydrogenase family protein n=1 Tax=Rhizobium sp. Root1220 TaxID=1736432 RepID=UPI0006F31E57|nr:acyl-CoA dehydrogenase family protein [Rhizobium sp. Root1220]KQV83818.1 monooxygenase [Rhizobium sp. Root1220]